MYGHEFLHISFSESIWIFLIPDFSGANDLLHWTARFHVQAHVSDSSFLLSYPVWQNLKADVLGSLLQTWESLMRSTCHTEANVDLVEIADVCLLVLFLSLCLSMSIDEHHQTKDEGTDIIMYKALFPYLCLLNMPTLLRFNLFNLNKNYQKWLLRKTFGMVFKVPLEMQCPLEWTQTLLESSILGYPPAPTGTRESLRGYRMVWGNCLLPQNHMRSV